MVTTGNRAALFFLVEPNRCSSLEVVFLFLFFLFFRAFYPFRRYTGESCISRIEFDYGIHVLSGNLRRTWISTSAVLPHFLAASGVVRDLALSKVVVAVSCGGLRRCTKAVLSCGCWSARPLVVCRPLQAGLRSVTLPPTGSAPLCRARTFRGTGLNLRVRIQFIAGAVCLRSASQRYGSAQHPGTEYVVMEVINPCPPSFRIYVLPLLTNVEL